MKSEEFFAALASRSVGCGIAAAVGKRVMIGHKKN